MALIGPLQGLLAPYVAAWSGTPTPIGTGTGTSSDPLMALLLSSLRQGGAGGAPGGGQLATGQVATGDALLPGSPVLQSRRGVTLQQSALASLLRAARLYDYLPKGRELGLFGSQSTYRTPAEQAALYAAKPDLAAPPGQSLHQQGLALDLPAQLQTDAFKALLRRLGWAQFSPTGEPWHMSFGPVVG